MSEDELESFVQYYERQDIVKISLSQVNALAKSICNDRVIAEFVAISSSVRLPLNFANLDEEINFMGIVNILMICSNYETRAREAHQDNLEDVILFGVIGLYLSNRTLSASTMTALQTADIGGIFTLPLYERNTALEMSCNLPIATIETRGALADYADQLSGCLKTCGALLERHGFHDIASYLFNLMKESSSNVEDLVRSVSGMFPILDDRELVSMRLATSPPGQETVTELNFHKNVRRLIHGVISCLKRTKGDGEGEGEGGCSNTTDSPWLKDVDVDALHTDKMLAAPSIRGIAALFHTGCIHTTTTATSQTSSITTATDIVNQEESSVSKTSTSRSEEEQLKLQLLSVDFDCIKKTGVYGTVSVRAAAVVACHQICDAVHRELLLQKQQHQQMEGGEVSMTTTTTTTSDTSSSSSSSLLSDTAITATTADTLLSSSQMSSLFTPMTISLYLDTLCKDSTRGTLFVPNEGCPKW